MSGHTGDGSGVIESDSFCLWRIEFSEIERMHRLAFLLLLLLLKCRQSKSLTYFCSNSTNTHLIALLIFEIESKNNYRWKRWKAALTFSHLQYLKCFKSLFPMSINKFFNWAIIGIFNLFLVLFVQQFASNKCQKIVHLVSGAGFEPKTS